jgi:glucokinase
LFGKNRSFSPLPKEGAMTTAIGVVMTSHIVTGRLEDQRLTGKLLRYPSDPEAANELDAIPGSELVEILAEHIGNLAGATAGGAGKADAIGVAVPGIVRSGVIEESPNLKQLKGMRLAEELANALVGHGIGAPVYIANDADAIAAGVAATRGKLDKVTRVWTIGKGIGYGRWPHADGVWEGGHITVTLDPKERYCGCGGAGHLEGIMGHRAMRLRFLDLEPEEVFANARQGDERCANFELLWHRALAAASATSVHLDGPGKFFITGPNSRFIRAGLLSEYLQEMVAMSPLQGSVFEVIPANEELAVLGAAVNAQGQE